MTASVLAGCAMWALLCDDEGCTIIGVPQLVTAGECMALVAATIHVETGQWQALVDDPAHAGMPPASNANMADCALGHWVIGSRYPLHLWVGTMGNHSHDDWYAYLATANSGRWDQAGKWVPTGVGEMQAKRLA